MSEIKNIFLCISELFNTVKSTSDAFPSDSKNCYKGRLLRMSYSFALYLKRKMHPKLCHNQEVHSLVPQLQNQTEVFSVRRNLENELQMDFPN